MSPEHYRCRGETSVRAGSSPTLDSRDSDIANGTRSARTTSDDEEEEESDGAGRKAGLLGDFDPLSLTGRTKCAQNASTARRKFEVKAIVLT
jgi:hypothetical protein